MSVSSVVFPTRNLVAAGSASAKEAARFLIQSTFGPTPQTLQQLLDSGYEAWLAEQFSLPRASHADYVRAAPAPANPDDVTVDPFMESFWLQALTGRDQLRQRIAFALSEILVISCASGPLENEPLALATYLDLLGQHAFGNFWKLLVGVTLHPAMGAYLNMLQNDKEDPTSGQNPNENYARELLQLFTIGLYRLNADGTVQLDAARKPIPTYDQDTIKGFAKVMTGWGWGNNPDKESDNSFIDPDRTGTWDYPMESWPNHHSASSKKLLNGVVLAPGQSAEQDLKDGLDNIFHHPNVGPFIAKRLIQRLVTSNPSPAYVSRVAAAFADDGGGVRGNLKQVVRAILLDPEARDVGLAATPRFGKLKEPVLRFSGLLRAFAARSPSGKYGIYNLEDAAYGLNQNPFRAPSVFNFFSPFFSQPGILRAAGLASPEFQITHATSIVGVANVLHDTIMQGYGDESDPITLDFSAYTPLAADPASLVDQIALLLCADSPTPAARATMAQAVSSVPADDALTRAQTAAYLIVISPQCAVQQ